MSSVSEGLIGVSDDAYTNAVARKNLEIYRSFNRIRGPGGEVVTLDEATRQAKIKETEAQIKENCR